MPEVVKYTVKTITCSACGRPLKKEIPRVGPPRIRCGHCGAELNTGLKPWSDMSVFRKVWTVIADLISPRGHGDMGCVLGPVMWAMGPFVTVVGLMVGYSAITGNPATNLSDEVTFAALLLGLMIVPAFRLARLVAAVQEASSLSLPTWKA